MSLNATEIFLGVEAALPPGAGADVYLEAVAGYLSKMFDLTAPAHFWTQLYILSALFALQLLLMLASVALRIKMGSCWFIAVRRTTIGNYLTPNLTVSWQYLVIVFIVCLEINCWFLVYWSKGVDLRGFYVQEILIWLGWWYAAILSVWALVVARSEQLLNSGQPIPFYMRPLFVHLIFPGYSTLGLCKLLPWAVVTEVYYQRFYHNYIGAIYGCLGAAQEANALKSTQLAALEQQLINTTQLSLDSFKTFVWAFKASYVDCLAGTLVVYVMYFAVGLPALVRMYNEVRTSEREKHQNAILSANRRESKIGLLTAAATFLLMTLFATAYSTLAAFVGTQHLTPDNFSSKGYTTALASLWITGGLGLFACFVALYRSISQFNQQRKPRSAGPSLGFNSDAIVSAARARTPLGRIEIENGELSTRGEGERVNVTIERSVEVEGAGAIEMSEKRGEDGRTLCGDV